MSSASGKGRDVGKNTKRKKGWGILYAEKKKTTEEY